MKFVAVNKVAATVAVTVLMIGLTGAAIFRLVYLLNPFVGAVGFSSYVMIAAVLMLLRVVRIHRWEVSLDDLHTEVAEVSDNVTELKDYVHRNL